MSLEPIEPETAVENLGLILETNDPERVWSTVFHASGELDTSTPATSTLWQ